MRQTVFVWRIFFSNLSSTKDFSYTKPTGNEIWRKKTEGIAGYFKVFFFKDGFLLAFLKGS